MVAGRLCEINRLSGSGALFPDLFRGHCNAKSRWSGDQRLPLQT